jgi:hypothetical protein
MYSSKNFSNRSPRATSSASGFAVGAVDRHWIEVEAGSTLCKVGNLVMSNDEGQR